MLAESAAPPTVGRAPHLEMGLAARACVRRLGFSIFPVGPDCRRPLTEHGVHEASKDPEQIAAWWERWPTANIAIACGSASGVFGLDVDCKPGGADGFASIRDMEDLHGPLPRTWRVLTPSGGEHRYFRQPLNRPLRNRVGSLKVEVDGVEVRFPGLDVRGDFGSMAAPPSVKPGGVYRWADHPEQVALADAPEWLLEIIDPPEPPRPPAPPLRLNRGSVDRITRYVEQAIDGECGALSRLGKSSGRNLKLFQASANLHELVAANLVSGELVERYLLDAAQACGLLQEDGVHAVRATIASGRARGLLKPREVQCSR